MSHFLQMNTVKNKMKISVFRVKFYTKYHSLNLAFLSEPCMVKSNQIHNRALIGWFESLLAVSGRFGCCESFRVSPPVSKYVHVTLMWCVSIWLAIQQIMPHCLLVHFLYVYTPPLVHEICIGKELFLYGKFDFILVLFETTTTTTTTTTTHPPTTPYWCEIQ